MSEELSLINYGYFRHRFDAHTNSKLNELADELGVAAYGYYYTLLELYGAKYAAKNDGEPIIIHTRMLANTWRKRVDSCHLVLTKLQLSGLLVFTKCKNTYVLDIPKFSNYYGSYKKTDRSTVANKSKVNKSKEKIYIAPDEIVQLWNDTMPSHGFKHSHGLGMNQHLKNFLDARKFLLTKDDWSEVFTLCIENDFLSGKVDGHDPTTLTQVVNYDMVIKIKDGFYNRSGQNKYDHEKWKKDFLTREIK